MILKRNIKLTHLIICQVFTLVMFLTQSINGYIVFYSINLFINQPLVGQYKKDEYNDDLIVKFNKLAAKFSIQKVLSIPFFLS